MPAPNGFPTGSPCWIELFTTGLADAERFYSELFGWTFESAGEEYGNYNRIYKDGRLVAGAMDNSQDPEAPNAWTVYLNTPDLAAHVQRAKAAGATVVIEDMQVMDLGSMGGVIDPGGAYVGLWQPAEHKGFEVIAEDGAASWFELHTREFDASVAFYRDVLDWPVRIEADTPEFRYVIYGDGDDPRAGIMDDSVLPGDMPPHWAVYLQTPDADATAKMAPGLGGNVVMEPEDTPYGRLAMVADPNGVVFRLLQP